MVIYKNKVEWRGGHLGYTWCQNGTEMQFSAPPDLHGMPDVMTPEDAFMASSNTCYFMMVLWAATRFKLNLVSLECRAEGEVEELLDRTSWFRKLTLYPKIVVKDQTREFIQRALDMALKYSTVNQSLKSQIVIESEIIVQ
ncbi:MAG: OsmC family protein [Candidatus Riflebacteria bacterium]|nr:OsmC family protein [Candidatus Riflebacteria bacterium]